MNAELNRQLKQFIEQNHLPKTFIDVINHYYLPLAEWINRHRPVNHTWIIGLNGAQGTGKTTLSTVLKIILEQTYRCHTATLSLDDLYLPRADRKALAQSVHPLLQTRGAPGTHDTQLGIRLLDELSALKDDQTLLLPRFDKACDERFAEDKWEAFTGPADIVIFEGWCMGASASPEEDLTQPINELETQGDKDGRWRRYVNDKLQTEYKALFARNDLLIMLKAPDFDCIHRWRWEQEQKLAATFVSNTSATKTASTTQPTQLMDEAGITRFIQHYERLTRQNLKQLPEQADILLKLDENHNIASVHYNTTRYWQRTPFTMASHTAAPELLIFTDLDGTLLDHHDYSFAPAATTIDLLNKLRIAWIFNTSKTLAEVLTLCDTLHNRHPMIVENGGGIAIPVDHPLAASLPLTRPLSNQSPGHTRLSTDHRGFQLKTIGESRANILDILKPLRAHFAFTGFSDMNAAKLVDVTGLSTAQAEQALQREFSEPIIWRDSEAKLNQFHQLVTEHSLHLLRGGRFIHVIGNSDKGIAMNWLSALYRQARPELKTVALGDGENDVAMLKQADIPIIIRSPVHSPPTVERENTVLSESCGPRGWSESLQMLLKEFGY